MANEAFSTSATFDEPMEQLHQMLIAAGVVIGRKYPRAGALKFNVQRLG